MSKYAVSALKFVMFSAIFAIAVILLSLNNIELVSDKPVSANDSSQDSLIVTNIIIDPGHGGEDGGANANGVSEKEINFIISKHLNDYFKFSKFIPQMTREDDRLLYNAGQEGRKKYYDLINRVEFANEFDNAIFLSIHQNKFEISKYKGLQVYYSKNNSQSQQLADIIQNNSKIFIDTENTRDIKKADHRIRVLDSLYMPAVLVECGFISNPEEALKLADAEYQKKIAFMVFISTLQFIDENGETINEK